MGGAGGTPDLKDPAGIGGSRSTLENKGITVPEWAAGDTMGSWLTKAFPGVQMNAQNVSEATTGNTGTVSAPEPTTMASLGFPAAGNRPPEYAAGTGNRTETITRQAEQPMRPTAPIAAAPAAPAADPNAAKAKGDDWVYANIPTAYWQQGEDAIVKGAQPGGNFAGVYMPQGLTRSNAANYMEAGTMATMGGQPLPPAQFKPGDALTGVDPATQPRMRRALYDFNMANYGNPYGPHGNYSNPPPPSFLMQTGGG